LHQLFLQVCAEELASCILENYGTPSVLWSFMNSTKKNSNKDNENNNDNLNATASIELFASYCRSISIPVYLHPRRETVFNTLCRVSKCCDNLLAKITERHQQLSSTCSHGSDGGDYDVSRWTANLSWILLITQISVLCCEIVLHCSNLLDAELMECWFRNCVAKVSNYLIGNSSSFLLIKAVGTFCHFVGVGNPHHYTNVSKKESFLFGFLTKRLLTQENIGESALKDKPNLCKLLQL